MKSHIGARFAILSIVLWQNLHILSDDHCCAHELERAVLPLPLIMPTGSYSAAVDQGQVAASDSLVQIAQILPAIYLLQVFGDTDHDGLNEVIFGLFDPNDSTNTLSYRILEEQGNNVYHQENVGPYMVPSAVGELDKDGKSEVVGQYSYSIQVYESPTPNTYPSVLTWSSPPLGGNVIGQPTIGDTDRDGKSEIIHSINTFSSSRLVIYENDADNSFVQVYLDDPTTGATGRKLVADLDGDGLIEIAFAGTYGDLFLYESPSDNVWQRIFTERTEIRNAYAVNGGVDTDGNGKPELFVAGDSDAGRTVYVYEASGDNNFVRVASFIYYDGYRGYPASAVADIDGVGRSEFVLGVHRKLLVYRAVAPGEWIMNIVATDPSPAGVHGGINAFDVNQNSRAEIFWSADGSPAALSTLVLEHPKVPATAVDFGEEKVGPTLSVVPNPCRGTATLILGARSRLVTPSAIAVFDVAGKLVSRRLLVRSASGQITLPTQSLGSGVYILRLEEASGKPIATGRTTVIR